MKTNELVGNIAVLQDMLNGATQEQWIALRAAMDALLQVKAFEDGERGKWIPVEERLPETHAPYEDAAFELSDFMLVSGHMDVCGEDLEMFVAQLEDDKPEKAWVLPDGEMVYVDAWQPLPEPYHKLP